MNTVNLVGLLRNAADLIPPRKDHGAYAFALGEVADHVEMVRNGEATLDQLADLYSLRPEAAK